MSIKDYRKFVMRRGLFVPLARDNTAHSHTGDTNETALASVIIPGNSMGRNGTLRVISVWAYTNSANTKTTRMRLGGMAGSIFWSQAATTNAGRTALIELSNRNNPASQVANVGGSDGVSLGTGAIIVPTVDTTQDQLLVFSAQLANAGETITLHKYRVEIMQDDD